MKPVTTFVCFLILVGVLFGTVSAQSNQTSVDKIHIKYFYGVSCPHCPEVNRFMDEISNKYPNVVVERYEVYFNSSNQELFRKTNDEMGVPNDKRGVPEVFIENQVFIGKTEIEENLEPAILGKYEPEKQSVSDPFAVLFGFLLLMVIVFLPFLVPIVFILVMVIIVIKLFGGIMKKETTQYKPDEGQKQQKPIRPGSF